MRKLADLEDQMPWIPWRTPLSTALTTGSYFACRPCIADNGLQGTAIANAPGVLHHTTQEWQEHFLRAHGATKR